MVRQVALCNVSHGWLVTKDIDEREDEIPRIINTISRDLREPISYYLRSEVQQTMFLTEAFRIGVLEHPTESFRSWNT